MTMPPSGEQPAYVDPVTGQPLYIDPVTGQLAYTDPTAAQAPAPGYPPVSPYPTDPSTYPGYGVPNPYQPVDPSVSGVPATGYTTPAVPPMGYGYPGYGYPMMPLQRRTSPMAITGMVLSICGAPFLFCYGVGGLLGLAGAIVSHVARRQIKARNEDGGGMALAGIIIGWICAAVGLALVVLFVWIFTNMNNFDNLNNVQ
jgi:hypothetical protein